MDKQNHIYQGIKEPRCTIDGEPLPKQPSLKVKSHSPDGFSWGYQGSGPSQLSLAIMLIETNNDEERALKYYEAFRNEVIAKLNIDTGWSLASQDIQTWLREKDNEENLRKPAKPYVQGEITPYDCFHHAHHLNIEAERTSSLQAVDMDHLRSNMHMMRGYEFVEWFVNQYGPFKK